MYQCLKLYFLGTFLVFSAWKGYRILFEAEMIIGHDSTEEETYKIFRQRT
jgi:hypothetical protein